MRRNTSVTPHSGHSLKLAFLFIGGVTIVIFISIFIRIGIVIHKSTYDPSHRFTIAAISSSTTSTIYSFDKPTNTIVILRVSGLPRGVPVAKATSVFVDATLPSEALLTHGGFIAEIPDVLFFHKSYDGMTGYDIARLATFLSITPPGNITSKSLKLPGADVDLRTLTPNLFTDDGIVKENKSIHIINATGVSGVGTRLEGVLANSGATVIAIDGDDTVVSHTSIDATTPSSYTAQKIGKYLHVFPRQQTNNGLSDIIVTLGKDALTRNQF